MSVNLVYDGYPCRVERRADGAVVVRVHSGSATRDPLPDAVFAFQPGDPQYRAWDDRLRQHEGGEKAQLV